MSMYRLQHALKDVNAIKDSVERILDDYEFDTADMSDERIDICKDGLSSAIKSLSSTKESLMLVISKWED